MSVAVSGDIGGDRAERPLVVLAIPAQSTRGVAATLAPLLHPEAIVVVAAKGSRSGRDAA